MKKLDIQKTENYVTQDKLHAPFLLACSFNGLINFISSFTHGDIVYWEFAPVSKAKDLVEKFEVKIDPEVPIKDIFSAQDVFWRKVYEAKRG